MRASVCTQPQPQSQPAVASSLVSSSSSRLCRFPDAQFFFTQRAMAFDAAAILYWSSDLKNLRFLAFPLFRRRSMCLCLSRRSSARLMYSLLFACATNTAVTCFSLMGTKWRTRVHQPNRQEGPKNICFALSWTCPHGQQTFPMVRRQAFPGPARRNSLWACQDN